MIALATLYFLLGLAVCSRRHLKKYEGADTNGLSCKVVTVGKYNVGKTAIISRMRYPNRSLLPRAQTIAPSMTVLAQQYNDSNISLKLWDTAGQERFSALSVMYVRGAHVALVVFDMTDLDSLRVAQQWLQRIHREVDPMPKIIVVGNKCDLDGHAVSDDAVKDICVEHQASFISVSAKTGENVAFLVKEIARLYVVSPRETTPSDVLRPTANLERPDRGADDDCC